jgi:hypothetical protein
MIEIPSDVRIISTLKQGMVYYFIEESFSSDEAHYFIVLNKDPRGDPNLLLVCASSKVEKRKKYAKQFGYAPETLVIVQPSEYTCFTVETVIDCNTIIEKNIHTIVTKLTEEKLRIYTEQIPQAIIEKLVNGVKMSNQHSEVIKDKIFDN